MINNSSLDRWNRLESKSLDQEFTNEIIQGLNCSPFEASAVLDTVYNVFSSYFETNPALKPGQIRLQILAIEAKVSQPISESRQLTVTLTLNDDREDYPIRKLEYGNFVLLEQMTKTTDCDTDDFITCTHFHKDSVPEKWEIKVVIDNA